MDGKHVWGNDFVNKQPGAKDRKVFVYGIDGGTLVLLRPWAARGLLPNFRRLMEEGTWGVLHSCFPPITPQAWSCFMTGKNAGKHGIFHYTDRLPDSYGVRYINAGARAARTIQRIVSDEGKRVGFLNVPMTFPPEPVNGFVVSGLDAPSISSEFTYPPELKGKIQKITGEYIIDLRLKGSMTNKKRQRVLDDLHKMEEIRKKVLFNLMAQDDYDLLMYVCIATDRVQHHFWKFLDPSREPEHGSANNYEDAILRVYQHADKTLGEIMSRLPSDMDLAVMSDHGFGPATTAVFYPNKWLLENRLLHLKDHGRDATHHPVKTLKGVARRLVFGSVRGSKRFLIRTLPPSLKERLLEFSSLRGRVQSFILLSQVAWSQTVAFSDEIMDGIWINVKGREPEGIVEPGEEYERVREDIIRRLKDLKDPHNGEQVFEVVYKREDLFHGPYIWKAPDILFHFKDYTYRMRPSNTTSEDSRQGVFGHVDSEGRTSGSHRREGVFFLWGRNFRRGTELSDIQIIDMAPTILHNMGLGVPDDMDGRVITEALVEPGEIVYQSSEKGSAAEPSGTAYSTEESQQIEERLRAIGYIE
jgi:predicted AlkP superfamily phosphohydrolase/phosphomutase